MLRVTEILRLAGFIDTTFYTERGRDRGSAVHAAIALDHEDDLDESSVDPEYRLYLEQFRRFKSEVDFEPLAWEQEVTHPVGFVGHYDVLARINDKEGILDFKLGAKQAWHALQTAAYARCHPRPMKRWALYLGLDRYSLVTHEDPQDWTVFLAAFTVATWRKRHGI